MSFEDLLGPKMKPCNVCNFLAALSAKLRAEVETALAKPEYSAGVLVRGMAQLRTDTNPAPGEQSVRSHREKGHAV